MTTKTANIDVAVQTRRVLDITRVLKDHGITRYVLPDDLDEPTYAIVTDEQYVALMSDERVTYLSEL